MGYSRVELENTLFQGEESSKAAVAQDETTGAHIYAILDSDLRVKNCTFRNGRARMGGAMFIEGNSTA
jgi:hypothetical protein